MHHLGSLLSATIEYYAADQIEMCYSEKKKKKSLPSLCRQSSRRFENRSPLHLTSQLQDFVLNLLSQFALGGHSTTMWTKFYPIMTPSPLKWTIVVILHDTFPFPMSLVFHKKSYLVCVELSNFWILRNIYLFSSSCVCPVGCLSFVRWKKIMINIT